LQEFTIVCTTCQSRIKVRNSSLIGQIVPCPKCAGMVMVENPSKIIVNPVGTPANSQTVTKESLAPPVASVEGVAVEGEAGRRQRFKSDSVATSKRSSDGSEQQPRIGGATSKVESKSPASPTVEQPLDTNPASADWNRSNLSQSEWTTSRARMRRQILLVFFLSLSGCIIAGVLFTLFVKSLSSDKSELASADSTIKTPSTNELSADPPRDVKLEDPVKPEGSGQQPQIGVSENESQVNKSIPPDTEKLFQQSEDNQAKEMTEVKNPAKESKPSTSDTDGEATNAAPQMELPQESSGSKVIDQDAKPKDLGEEKKSTDTEPKTGEEMKPSESPALGPDESEKQGKGQQLPDSLLKLAAVFDPSLETRVSETPVTEAPVAKPNPDIGSLSITTKEKLHPPAEKPIPTAKRLAEELAGIEIVDRPLAEVIEVWSQISGLGIEIAWNEVAAANVLPAQKINYKSGRISYGDMLSAMLEPLGLVAIAAEESLVRIAAKPEATTGYFPEDWTVSDLLSEKCNEVALKQLVDKLLPTMQESWKITDGKVDWGAKEKNVFQQFALLEVLEHLRVMRGLPLKSSYDPNIFQRSWPAPASIVGNTQKLQQPVNKQVAVSQVVVAAGREVDGLITFDWAGTWQHGLAPMTEDTLLPRGRTLEQLAVAVSNKYGLDPAWLSSEHILLTTAARLARMETTVHFEVNEATDPEVLKKKLAVISALSPEGLPSIRFARDPHSGMVLAKIRPLRTSEIPQGPW
jgi:hypothetical protein